MLKVKNKKFLKINFVFLKIESPRLCVYPHDPSQYYPCVIDHIGIHSWSLYQCPDQSIFDETSQQCLMKIPIDDQFEQFISSASIEDTQFQKVASFIVPDTEEKKDEIEPFTIKRLFNEVKYYLVLNILYIFVLL